MHSNIKHFRPEIVCLESLELKRRTLHGTVYCKNVAFEKQVLLVGSWDLWQTRFEIECDYVMSVRGQPYDIFSFEILLDGPDDLKLDFCLKYSVGNEIYWDNNESDNYQIDLYQTERKKKSRSVFVEKPTLMPRLECRRSMTSML
ncbi:putative phosphatase regulatory subunit-domain-containing protein [Gorgonomyces haynaldii]|nr:putative phosphatase regulatory subunit-domain-containing protein [Gorgonomyces haynaldii]